MKLLIYIGRCVQTDCKRCFQTLHKHNGKYSIQFHTLNFIVLNILMGIGYIMEGWLYIIRIIYTFLKLHLQVCIQPKQSLAPPHPNVLHSTKFSEPSTDYLLLPGTCFTLFHDCRLQHHSNLSVISSNSLKSFNSLLSTTRY